MKTVEFNEEQLGDLIKIGDELFCDEKDPRSTTYIRELKRPIVNWLEICLAVFLPLIILVVLVFVLCYIGVSITISILVAVIFLSVYIVLNFKKTLICIIKIYQRYSPDALRNKCRFEPSCSEYMILSIEKYGPLKGLKKGIYRLKRCNINGGGFDFP